MRSIRSGMRGYVEERVGEMNVKKPAVHGTFARLFGTPLARMLDVLILNRGYDLSMKELAEYAGITPKTVWKELPKLEEIRLVKHTRRIGHAKMVTLNRESNPLAEHLIAIEFDAALKEMESRKTA